MRPKTISVYLGLLAVGLLTGAIILTGCSSDSSGTGSSATAGAATGSPASSRSTTSLVFPKNDFTLVTKTVTTSAGDKKVTYRLYKHITYVANPVDADYQSMDVMVPVKIDGVKVDASDAPILFNINVGGYMSSANTASSTSSSDPQSGGDTPSGAMPSGSPPSGAAPDGATSGGATSDGAAGAMPGGSQSDNASLALAAGYVVVSPGCRGRDNVTSSGTYYGKAPAAIVDLKAAVRYIRANQGVLPGNTDRIVSTGSSAGGALSALLGASGDSPLYDSYLEKLGAADASDRVYAVASYCPITDLEHADGAYEWMFGTTAVSGGTKVDQTVSKQLKAIFADYQASLDLTGQNGFGTVTAGNYADYLLKTYLYPAAEEYLSALSASERAAYLKQNSWITWSGGEATFSFADYVAHVGRMKGAPAFDTFDLSSAENVLFGNATTDARHFTDFSLQNTSSDSTATVGSSLQQVVNLMNPMYFLQKDNSGCAEYWWIRYGTSDSDTSLPVIANLALAVQNTGKSVDSLMYWDGGHGANEDAEAFIKWIGTVTGYTK